jgi:hypothetical protein
MQADYLTLVLEAATLFLLVEGRLAVSRCRQARERAGRLFFWVGKILPERAALVNPQPTVLSLPGQNSLFPRM